MLLMMVGIVPSLYLTLTMPFLPIRRVTNTSTTPSTGHARTPLQITLHLADLLQEGLVGHHGYGLTLIGEVLNQM